MTTTASDYSHKQSQISTLQYPGFQYTSVQELVESLLQSRVETLSLYKDIMSFRPFEQNDMLREVLEDFCESIVDYTARAHFKLYDFLDADRDRNRLLAVTGEFFSALVDNTQHILDFHDQYNGDIVEYDCNRLSECLNQVGELLADRLLLEDHIIDTLLSLHGSGC